MTAAVIPALPASNRRGGICYNTDVFWNPFTIPALVGTALLFHLGGWLGGVERRAVVRWSLLVLLLALCLPACSFIVYYLHLVREPWWYVEFRSLPGIETLAACWGLLFGFAAGCVLPRSSPGRITRALLLVLVCVLTFVPFLKPILNPVESAGKLQDRWDGQVCLQTSPATCGPASLATIYAYYGMHRTEADIARTTYACSTGTELWYLLRDARAHGLRAVPVHIDTLDALPAPCLIGLNLGAINAGHFVVYLGTRGDLIVIGDPMTGEILSLPGRLSDPYATVKQAVYFVKDE